MVADSQPLVSIIIPVYNGANYLCEAVNSALAQTYGNIEVIVVNDGSVDSGATEDIALSYGDTIRYYRKENGGVASALNYGLRESRGEYFCWLSHDDVYYPSKVETMLVAVRERSDPTTPAYANYDVLDMETGVVTPVRLEKTHPIEKLEQGLYAGLFPGLATATTWFIHMSHFQRVGLFDEALLVSQDFDMGFRIFRGQRAIFVEDSVVCIRRHEEQGTRTLTPTRWDEIYSACRQQFASITETEATALFGGMYQFYVKMIDMYSGYPDSRLYEMALQRLKEVRIPPGVEEKVTRLRHHLDTFGWKGITGICIFCAGSMGLRLANKLRLMQIDVVCFSDNAPEKWGRKYFGIPCVKPSAIDLEETLIVAAVKDPKQVLRQLKDMRAEHVTTMQALEPWL